MSLVSDFGSVWGDPNSRSGSWNKGGGYGSGRNSGGRGSEEHKRAASLSLPLPTTCTTTTREKTPRQGNEKKATKGKDKKGRRRGECDILVDSTPTPPRPEQARRGQSFDCVRTCAASMPSLSLDSGRSTRVSPVAMVAIEVDCNGIVRSPRPYVALSRTLEREGCRGFGDVFHSNNYGEKEEVYVLASHNTHTSPYNLKKKRSSFTHLAVPFLPLLSGKGPTTLDATVDCARLCGVAIAICVSASESKLCKKECADLVATIEDLYWEIDQITSTLSESVMYHEAVEQSMMESLISTMGEALSIVQRCERKGQGCRCLGSCFSTWCTIHRPAAKAQLMDLRRDLVGIRAKIIVSTDLCSFLNRWAEECDGNGRSSSSNSSGGSKVPLKGRRRSLAGVLQDEDDSAAD